MDKRSVWYQDFLSILRRAKKIRLGRLKRASVTYSKLREIEKHGLLGQLQEITPKTAKGYLLAKKLENEGFEGIDSIGIGKIQLTIYVPELIESPYARQKYPILYKKLTQSYQSYSKEREMIRKITQQLVEEFRRRGFKVRIGTSYMPYKFIYLSK